METRYRTAYQTENYTVSRPVSKRRLSSKYTVMKPVYQTETPRTAVPVPAGLPTDTANSD